MKYKVLDSFKGQTKQGEIELQPGQTVTLADNLAVKLIEKGKITHLESISVISWLEKLSASEKEIFEERSAIMEYEGGLHRELAEVEAIKRIIKERVIPGKCDRCERVKGCMLTKKQMLLCAVVKPNRREERC